MFCEKLATSMVTRSICSTLSTPNLQALEASYASRKQGIAMTRTSPQNSPRAVGLQMKTSFTGSMTSSSWGEAPARLGASPKDGLFHRQSRPRVDQDDIFCKLDQLSPMSRVVIGTDLGQRVDRADHGMRTGVKPFLAEGAMGGTYFFRDGNRKICVVFKPSDEEPMAPNNPHQQTHKYGAAYKGHITPGFGMFRELATYIIDRGLAGVPPTAIARARHPSFGRGDGIVDYKIGSVQSYLRHECSAEEMGPSKFDVRSVQAIALLDLRLCNQDRHPGNLLVCDENPYRTEQLRSIDGWMNEPLPQQEQQHHMSLLSDLNDQLVGNLPAVTSSTCSSDPFPFNFEDFDTVPELIRESSSELTDSLTDLVEEPFSAGTKRCCSTQSPAGSPMNPRAMSRFIEQAANEYNATIPSPPAQSPVLASSLDRTTTESSTVPSECRIQPGKYTLAPIDHGYCLPHVLYTGEAVFAWLDWPQAKEPLSPDLIEYVRSVDVNVEANAIMKCIGASLPPTALLTLKVCTYLLQQGVAANWTVEQIGKTMVRPTFGQLSKLEVLITQCMNKLRREYGGYDLTTTLSPRQLSIAEDERLLCEYADHFMQYIQAAIDELIAAGISSEV